MHQEIKQNPCIQRGRDKANEGEGESAVSKILTIAHIFK